MIARYVAVDIFWSFQHIIVVSSFPQPAGRRQALISAAGHFILLVCTIIDVVGFDENLLTFIIA